MSNRTIRKRSGQASASQNGHQPHADGNLAEYFNTLSKLETVDALPEVLGFEPHYSLPEPRKKKDTRQGWNRVRPPRRLLEELLDPRTGKAASELGIVTGENSNWPVRPDPDQPEAAAILRALLPPTGLVSGRYGAPGSAPWYRIISNTEAVAKKLKLSFDPLADLQLPDGTPRRTTVGELLTTGQHSLIPPSRHETDPGGYLWTSVAAPATMDGVEHASIVREGLIGGLLAIYWPTVGSRHDADLALQGFLATYSDWDAERIATLVQLVARYGHDEEWHDRGRLADVEETLRRVEAGEPAPAKPRLEDLLAYGQGEAVVAKIRAFMTWKKAVRGPGVQRGYTGELPVLYVSAKLSTLVDQALDVLRDANDPTRDDRAPTLYVRGGELSRIRTDEHQRPVIAPVPAPGFSVDVDRVMQFIMVTKDDKGHRIEIPVRPPRDVVDGVLAAPAFPLPALTGITEVPIMRPDGSALTTPGYDVATGFLYAPRSGAPLVPAVSDAPSDAEIGAAFALLHDVFYDFPFVTPADRANALALLLTLTLRAVLLGNIPLALLDAPVMGSGKGLLATVVALVTTGHVVGTLPEVESDAELRKQITTELMRGRSFHLIDNVEGTLRSGILAELLTSDEWVDRLLATNRSVSIPASARGVWATTGNNLLVGGDMARRCYQIRLDPQIPNPSQLPASAFRHYPLTEWVTAERHNILHAALTVCRAWFARGKPIPDGVPTMGSFEAWARTLWGVLSLDPTRAVKGAAYDPAEFLANGPDLWQQGDEDTEEWDAFLRQLAKSVGWSRGENGGTTPFTAGQIAARVRGDYADDQLRDALPGGLAAALVQDGFAKRLGRAFRKQQGRRFGGDMIRLVRAGEDPHTKVVLWQVVYEQPPQRRTGHA